MSARGIRIWMVYGVATLATSVLVSVPARVGAQAAALPQAAVTARGWPSESPPRPLASRPVPFPPYEIRKLANGLQVVLVSHHEQPAVSVRMLVRAGAAQDPKGKMGLAMMTAALLDQGAGSRSAEQIADAIDFVGGILGTGAGTDLTYVNAVVMKDSLPLALQLMADVVRRPTFAPDELERQRQQALSGLKVTVEDPDNVASQVIDRLIYGFHPYGLPGNGTPQSLSGLTREDVVGFHRQYYAPNNVLLAIVGDVTADEAIKGVEQALGDWKQQEVPAFRPTEPPQPTKRIIVIDKPDAVQTEIRVGQIGIARRHDDFLALDQAVKILGGEGANRLQQVLRSQRGLTYGASADLDAYKTAGGIVAETDTRTDATAEALRVTVDEFYRLQRERVYENELEGAQAYMAGNFPLTIETPDAIATQVLNQLFYELPLTELQTFPERVRSITPDDVQRVARSYLRPERLAVVLVGNADGFVRDLKGVGFGEFERIPMDQVDLLSADLRRSRGGAGAFAMPRGGAAPLLPAALRMTAQYVADGTQPAAPAGGDKAAADALLGRLVEAHGGRDALLAVTRLVATASTSLTTPDGRIAAETRTAIEYPDRVRVDATVQGAQIVQVYADGSAWMKDPAGVHEAPKPMLDDLRAAVRRDPLALLRAAAEGTLDARLLPEEGNQGRVLKVLAIAGLDTTPVRVFVDGQSGRLVKVAFEARDRMRDHGVAEEIFDDYRQVGGVTVPFKASIVRNGRVILERTLTDLTINPPLPAETFARPAS